MDINFNQTDRLFSKFRNYHVDWINHTTYIQCMHSMYSQLSFQLNKVEFYYSLSNGWTLIQNTQL